MEKGGIRSGGQWFHHPPHPTPHRPVSEASEWPIQKFAPPALVGTAPATPSPAAAGHASPPEPGRPGNRDWAPWTTEGTDRSCVNNLLESKPENGLMPLRLSLPWSFSVCLGGRIPRSVHPSWFAWELRGEGSLKKKQSFRSSKSGHCPRIHRAAWVTLLDIQLPRLNKHVVWI